MSAGHTPGPWLLGEERSGDVEDLCGYLVAVVSGVGRSEGEYVANARMVAAAPELLEAAQGILVDDMFRYLPNEYIAKVRAAIAKATGS